MTKNKKKMAVYLAVKSAKMPLTLADIQEATSNAYSDRSIRRWLKELIEAGQICKLGEKRNAHYQAVLSTVEAIHYIEQPLFEREPVAYNVQWLDDYTPNKTFYLPADIRQQLHNYGSRAGEQETAGTYARRIYNRLLIDLSYNSSRLEGNTYSLLETERLLLDGTSAEGKLSEEHVMILNHKEAIRYLVDNAPRLTISTEVIGTLHYLLSEGLVASRYAGSPRDHGVRISASSYIPLENPTLLEQQIRRICEKGNPHSKSI